MTDGQVKVSKQDPAGVNPVKADNPNPSDPPAPAITPQQTFQPSLMEAKKEEKKKIALPKSFLIAAVTIILTITAGVVIALYLGKMTQRGPKQDQSSETKTPTLPVSTTPVIKESMQESSRSGKESTGSGSFESFLNQQESQEASASGPRVSTQSALPSP